MNQRADFRPFFLTAAHCLSSSVEAATVVVYWNYQSPSCGSLSGGALSQYQNGAAFCSTYSPSDFTLLELNSVPDMSYGVYYAGWDRTESVASAAVCIHHPYTEEKAISFENDALQSTAYLSSTIDNGANHWRVIDWDSGSTEPGSSGAGLWNFTSRRLIGQLHGGYAACGNNSSDWFGKLSVSWNGGGTVISRLSSWLDPDNTGLTGIDGQNPMGLIAVGDYICTTNGGRVSIVSYAGTGGAVTIPGTLNNMSVVSIGNSAFYLQTNLTSLVIPDSITNLGANAFDSCNNLTSVVFQGNIPVAGLNVFLSANNVIVYYLPGGTGWGSSFGGRPVRLKAGDYVCNVENGKISIFSYIGQGGAVTIPGTLNNMPVVGVGDSAFYLNSNLTSVVLPSSVRDIGQMALGYCTRLTDIRLPNTITNISAPAFESCSQLIKVAIPPSISKINSRTFYACSKLIHAAIPASVTNIGDSAFMLCVNLPNIMMPQSVIAIENSAFQECTSIARIVVPNKCVRIGNYAFKSCLSLTDATIG